MGGTLTSYRAALDYLFARTGGGVKFGLERMEALLAALRTPQRRYASVHIAGTNGKGSSAAIAESLLRAKGLRVGKYTSPHLVDFGERIVVDGRPIPPAAVADFVERWTPLVEEVGATFFEATTAMAFDWFARSDADVAVVEVGLGGRLDATNVILPRAAGVTSIGYDHTEYLGTTLEAIAVEKAGIFKPGVPAVIGDSNPGIASLLAERAREAGASDIVVVADAMPPGDIRVGPRGTSFTLEANGERQRMRTTLAGPHQARNVAFTVALLRAAGGEFATCLDDVASVLPGIRVPGRFQRVGSFIFDVAHNATGAEVLADTLAAVAPRRPIAAVFCVLRDKDWRGMIGQLALHVDRFVLTEAPTVPASRAWDLAEVAAFLGGTGIEADTVPRFDEALAHARKIGKTVLVTGSFHTVGDAMARLQVSPLAG
ncbi:MAG: bifunctional folylpolyglutamate synthase/dihydrofolate synthase [Gemmatimonadota bacterium]|nr:bifunctional folylpolyglutamate synthase/dihydrofolate synthase [Gemmatimonadota bacterium]